jgi:hypothetical protein
MLSAGKRNRLLIFLDHRIFVRGSTKKKSAIFKKLKTDDVQLLKFGFEWVKVFVWGLKSKQIRLR